MLFFFFSPRFKWLFISSLHLLFLCSRYQFILTEDSLGKHNAEKYNYFTLINATITTVQIYFFQKFLKFLVHVTPQLQTSRRDH